MTHVASDSKFRFLYQPETCDWGRQSPRPDASKGRTRQWQPRRTRACHATGPNWARHRVVVGACLRAHLTPGSVHTNRGSRGTRLAGVRKARSASRAGLRGLPGAIRPAGSDLIRTDALIGRRTAFPAGARDAFRGSAWASGGRFPARSIARADPNAVHLGAAAAPGLADERRNANANRTPPALRTARRFRPTALRAGLYASGRG